jgi:hypothetical protein
VTALHIAIGSALIAVNALAALWGGWRWHRSAPSRAFWVLLRAGQALVLLAAADGGILLLQGKELPPLHLIYGLVPIGVAFFAEQLRLASAQTILDRRGLESAQAVGTLPDPEQHALVREIVCREMGIMAASAAVVALLGIRAAGGL